MTVHAFFERSRGPFDLSGVSLHYVSGELPKFPTFQGDHWTPSVGWWESVEAYHANREGAYCGNKAEVEKQFPDIVYHRDRSEAVEAWRSDK